jgi:hypothetical protein
MASAYTPYKLKGGKVVQIPNAEVSKLQTMLGLSRAEAVDLWLYDEGYIENEEANELIAKSKENKISHNARADKPKTQRERVVKEDKVKEAIIQAVADLLPDLNATDVVIEKKGKLITFKVGADSFKFDLIRQRPPKDSKG